MRKLRVVSLLVFVTGFVMVGCEDCDNDGKRDVDDAGQSNDAGADASDASMATDTAVALPPGAPTDVTATVLPGRRLEIHWTIPPDNGTPIHTFQISLTNGNGYHQQVFDGAATGVTIEDLLLDSTYTVVVRAVSNAGAGPLSAPVGPILLIDVPAPPTLSGCARIGGARLRFSRPTYSTSVNLYYGPTPDVTPATGTLVEDIPDLYEITSMTVGPTYYYVATAVNALGESAPSAVRAISSDTGLHDTLVLANAEGIELWTCVDEVATGATTGTHVLTSPAITGPKPGGLTVDAASATLYVTDAATDRVMTFEGVTTLASLTNITPTRVLEGAATLLDDPRGIAVAHGKIFVANATTITVYPADFTMADTAPLAVVTLPVGSVPNQISFGGTRLWLGNGPTIVAWDAADTWAGAIMPATSASVRFYAPVQAYTGAWFDPGTGYIHMMMFQMGGGTSIAQLTWPLVNAAALNGNAQPNTWTYGPNAVGFPGRLPFRAGRSLFYVDGSAGSSVRVRTFDATNMNLFVDRTLTTSLSAGNLSGLYYVP